MHSLLIRKVYNTSEHPVFPGTPPYSGPKLPEAWPPLGASAAKGQDRTVRCATRWMIYKRPTNKIGDVETMTKRLPLAYPCIRLVWMRRDMASQVWSSLARFAPNVELLQRDDVAKGEIVPQVVVRYQRAVGRLHRPGQSPEWRGPRAPLDRRAQ
jgi:hypothetical protein